MVDIADEFPGPFPAPDDEHVPKVDPLAAVLLQDEIDRALHGKQEPEVEEQED